MKALRMSNSTKGVTSFYSISISIFFFGGGGRGGREENGVKGKYSSEVFKLYEFLVRLNFGGIVSPTSSLRRLAITFSI